MKALTRSLCAALVVASASATLAQNPQYWTGFGATPGWSDPANWNTFMAPTPTEILYFEDLFGTAHTNAAGVVNNVVNTSLGAGALYYQAVSAGSFSGVTNRFYTTLIPSGVTLSLGGINPLFYSAALAVGDVPGSGTWFTATSWTNHATITGSGTLSINDPQTLVSVGMRNRATLDLRGLNSLYANVNQVWAGVTRENTTTVGPVGWLLLGQTNFIQTPAGTGAPGVLLGYATNASGTGVLELGAANRFHTDGLTVGGRRSTASFLRFGAGSVNTEPPSTFVLRGSAGGDTPIPQFTIGDTMANPEGYGVAHPGNPAGSTGTADFSGGVVDILAESIWIGRGSTAAAATVSGNGNGTLIADRGVISTTNLYIGVKPTSANATAGQGNLTLRGSAVMNVAGDVALVFRTNGTAFLDASAINVSNNAVLNIGGDLTSVMTIGSWTPASVNLGGGTINLNGGQVRVPRLTGFGAINGASAITITNLFSVGGDTAVGTLNLGGDLTLGPVITNLTFNLGANNTIGGGVNDYLNVGNNLTLADNVNLNLTFGGPLQTGPYTLITYGGTQTGSVAWNNPTRSLAGLVQGAGQVALVVTQAITGNLVWKGPAGTGLWDNTTTNWNDNTDRFFTLDNVLFNDTAAATTINIPSGTVVAPSSVTFNNNALDYILTGGGRIDGFTGITKNGFGRLNLAISSTAQTFSGPVNIVQGTVRIDAFNTGMLGTATNHPLNIANGGQLDIGGGTVGSPNAYGRVLNVTGAGPDGMGAVTHITGSANPSLTVLGVNLLGNTTFGSALAGNTMNLVGVFTASPALLDFAGHTLTTVGPGNVRLNNLIATGAGDIQVGGPLWLQNCVLDGPGVINLGGNLLSFTTWSSGYIGKAITVAGGVMNNNSQSATPVVIGGPVTLAGPLSITNSQPFWFTNTLTGAGGLLKAGNSNLLLSAVNTYSGPTRIVAGRLALGPDATLVSPLIQIDPAGGLDVTARPAGYTIPTGQQVALAGLALGALTAGDGGVLSGGGALADGLTVSAGGLVAPGTRLAPGTLTASNHVVFNGGKARFKLGATTTPGGGVNDLLIVDGDLSFTAPTVIEIDPTATLAGTYTVIQYSGTLDGESNLQLDSDSRYELEFDLTVPGWVQVRVKGDAGNLTWRGGAPANPTLWDIRGATNWVNAGVPDSFYNGDTVNFDDSALTNRVTLQTELKPAAINFNQFSTAYTLEGEGSLLAGSITANGGGAVTIAYRGETTLVGNGLAVNAGSVSFNQSTNSTFTGKLSGFSSLNKQGPHTLTINNADSSSLFANIGVQGGTLRVGTSNALGAGTVAVSPGATLDLGGQAANTATVRVSGQGAAGAGAINNSGPAQTNAIVNLALDADTTLGAVSNRWDVAPGGSIQGGGYSLAKVGPGEVRLGSGTDTGLGNIAVNQGTLTFANPGTTVGLSSGVIDVRPGASLAFAAGVDAGDKPALVAEGGFIDGLQVTGAANLPSRYAGDVTFAGPGIVRMEGLANLTLGGDLRGPAGLRLAGSGTLNLAGVNSYAGDTTNNIGTLGIANSKALPDNSRLWNINNGTPSSSFAVINLLSNTITPANVPLIMVSTRGASGNLPTTLAGDGTWQGPIQLVGQFPSGTIEPEFRFSGGEEGLTVTGPISFTNSTATVIVSGGKVNVMSPLQFTGSLSFGQLGLGDLAQFYTTLTLGSSLNTWTNSLLIRGRINLAADNPFPAAPVLMRNLQGVDRFLTFDLAGHEMTVASAWQDTFSQTILIGNSSTNANATLIHAAPAEVVNTWAAMLVDDLDAQAGYTNQLGLTVTSGTLALLRTNTYTGPTLVSGGSLLLNAGSGLSAGFVGQISASPVTVSGTGTLGGVGTVLSPVTVNAGGTLAPGQGGVGRLTIANTLALNPGSRLACEVNITANTNDLVAEITDLTLNGCTLAITRLGAAPYAIGQTFKLFDAATYNVGTVALEPSVPGPGLGWDTSNLAVNGTIRIVERPEPPALGNLTVLPDGNFGFTLTGQAGQLYTIRASSDASAPLATWTILQSSALPQASWPFIDLTATNYPVRFYNVSTP